LGFCLRDARRYQPFTQTHHMQRPREYFDHMDARNLLPKHKKMTEEGDLDGLARERLKQNLHSHAVVWPTNENGEWKYHSTPTIPNWDPLPGRVTDNQHRWLQETLAICPWFQGYYDDWLAERASLPDSDQKRYEEEAVRKLCSVGYQQNHKKTLLKIMSMPLMEHEGDIFNDAIRVTALTIDIRYHQDELYYRKKESRGIFRHTVLLYKQRQYVLNRLRRNNFKLYCKTLEHLNIEHHSEPVFNTIYHKPMTMRVIDMKLRVMKYIETEVVKEALLRKKLSELQLEGEKIYSKDKETILKTNLLVDKLLELKSSIDEMTPEIEEEFSRAESFMSESENSEFLEAYLDLKRMVNDLNKSFDHTDRDASTVARLTKNKDQSKLTAEDTLNIITEVYQTTENIHKQCLTVKNLISSS